MDQIPQTLTQYELGLMWRLVVWACIAYLLILGALVFLRPAVVNRFFAGFAISGRINFLEAAFRLIAGLARRGRQNSRLSSSGLERCW